jgi:crotonobetainyl-CoA hydratase
MTGTTAAPASMPGFDPAALEFVTVDRDGPLTIVTIDRPERLNALHTAAHNELSAVFDDFAADPRQWVAIITGAGRAFCAGNDLRYQAEGGSLERPTSGFGGLTSRFDLDKPVIAAVNGAAMGGGFEIALSCDIVIAAEDAMFAMPEPRVGMAALASGLHRLPRTIGWQRAMGIILTGRRVTACEGESFGFINAVVPRDDVLDEARRWAALMLECSPLAIRAAKEIARNGLGIASLDAAIGEQRGGDALKAMLGSEDYREGPRAFAEKRRPEWRGR